MADASILREFLVKLGFKVDEAKLKKFTQGVETTTKRVAEFSVAITAAATAVEVAIVKIASQFDDLYYASQRLHASAENIQAFAFGISQVGGTAAGARAALEGLASFMRSNYGGEKLLQGWGIGTRDANGQLKQTTEIIDELAAKFRGMSAAGQYPLALAQANMLGIDEPTLMAMIRGTDQYSDQLHAFARRIGLDMSDGADASQKFMKGVRTLRMEFGLLIQKVGIDLLTRFGPDLERFLIWVGDHATEIAGRLEHWTSVLIGWGETLLRFARSVFGFFMDLDRATDGWSTTLIGLAAALKFSGILDLAGALIAINPELALIIGGILALGAAFVFLKADYDAWQKGAASKIDWGPWVGQIAQIQTDIGQLLVALHDLANVLGPILGPVIKTLVHGVLGELDHALTAIAAKIKLITDLLHGDWTAVAKDIINLAIVGNTPNAAVMHGALGDAAGQPDDDPAADAAKVARRTGAPIPAPPPAPKAPIGAVNPRGITPAAYVRQSDPESLADPESLDPESKPRTLVRALRELSDAMRQVKDELAANAGAGFAAQGVIGDARLIQADYTRPANDFGQPTGSTDDRGPINPIARVQQAAALLQKFGMTAAGALGLAAAGFGESGLEPTQMNKAGSGAAGAWQWLSKNRVAAFEHMFGKPITSASLEEQARFAAAEVLANPKWSAAINGAGSAVVALQNAVHLFEAPGAAYEAGDVRRGMHGLQGRHLGGDSYAGRSAQISQTTKIEVVGAGDPHAVGRSVAAEQHRVNGDLVRNLKSAVA